MINKMFKKVVVILIALVLTGLFVSQEVHAQAPTTNYVVEDYVDSDELLLNTQYTILDYVDELYKSETYISYVNDFSTQELFKYTTLNNGNDDPIVEIVPKSYFTNIGSETVVGDQYGFYIKTIQGGIGFNVSTVMVFDITAQTDLQQTIDRVIVELKPIFQYEYFVIMPNVSLFIHLETEVHVVPQNEARVIPKPNQMMISEDGNGYYPIITYGMVDRYYLKDISFGGKLLNEQELNYSDVGYNPYNDFGSYFTAFDYEYHGRYREYDSFPWESGFWLLGDVVTTIFAKPLKILVDIFDAISLTSSVIEFGDDLSRFSNGYIVTTENKYSTTAYYQNRNDQLANYRDQYNNPSLIKQTGVAINTTEAKTMWYGVNDYVTAYYTIGHSQLNGPTWQARMESEIALKVTDKVSNQVVDTSKGSTTYILREPTTRDLELNTQTLLYLLPHGINAYQFTPDFSGRYNISIVTDSPVEVEVNGILYNGSNISVPILAERDVAVQIQVKSTELKIRGYVAIDVSEYLHHHVIKGNDQHILKVGDISGVYKLTTTNPNIVIAGIYYLEDSELVIHDYFINSERDDFLTYPFQNIGYSYYVVFSNKTNYQQSVSFNVSLPDRIYEDTLTNIVMTPNLTYYSFTSTQAGMYVLSLTNTINSSFYYSVFDQNLNPVSSQSYKAGELNMNFAANTQYYIGVSNGVDNVSPKMIINRSANAYNWTISGGGYSLNTDVTGHHLMLKRGQTYTFKFWVNGIQHNQPIFIQQETNIYNLSINGITGVMTIPADAPLGGTGMILRASYGTGTNASYDITLRVTPEYEYRTLYPYVDNFNDIRLISSVPMYTRRIEYQVSVGSQKRIAYYDLPANNLDNYINVDVLTLYKQLGYTDSRYFTITITKLYLMGVNNQLIEYSVNHSTTAHSLFEGGQGTANSPFLLSSLRHLNNIRFSSEYVDPSNPYESDTYEIMHHFKLQNNIVISGAWVPIEDRYSGIFDGNGYEIKNVAFSISSLAMPNSMYESYGLFKKLYYGRIKNLTISGVEITGGHQQDGGYVYVGGIAGMNEGGIISNVTVKGRLLVYRYYAFVGGIVGYNYGGSIIENSSVVGTISSNGEVGGIAGVSSSSNINNNQFEGALHWNYVNGRVNFGNNNAGGIVGRMIGGRLTNNTNRGRIGYGGAESTSRTLQPCIAEIVGYTVGSVVLSNNARIGTIEKGYLRVITWKTGVWPFQTTHTHDQAKYVTSAQVGYAG